MRTMTYCNISVYEYMDEVGANSFENQFVKPSFMTAEDVTQLKLALERLCGLKEMNVLVLPDSDRLAIISRIGQMVNSWSIIYKPMFEKVHDLYAKEYNPIDNYDRYEDITDTGHSTSTSTSTGNSTSTGTSTSDSTSNSKSKIMPIDGSSDSDLVTSGGGDSTGTSDSASTSVDHSSSDSAGTAKSESVHTAHIHGNIGVTTSAQMITGEELLRRTFISDIEYIARTFEEEMTLAIYEV